MAYLTFVKSETFVDGRTDVHVGLHLSSKMVKATDYSLQIWHTPLPGSARTWSLKIYGKGA